MVKQHQPLVSKTPAGSSGNRFKRQLQRLQPSPHSAQIHQQLSALQNHSVKRHPPRTLGSLGKVSRRPSEPLKRTRLVQHQPSVSSSQLKTLHCSDQIRPQQLKHSVLVRRQLHRLALDSVRRTRTPTRGFLALKNQHSMLEPLLELNNRRHRRQASPVSVKLAERASSINPNRRRALVASVNRKRKLLQPFPSGKTHCLETPHNRAAADCLAAQIQIQADFSAPQTTHLAVATRA